MRKTKGAKENIISQAKIMFIRVMLRERERERIFLFFFGGKQPIEIKRYFYLDFSLTNDSFSVD